MTQTHVDDDMRPIVPDEINPEEADHPGNRLFQRYFLTAKGDSRREERSRNMCTCSAPLKPVHCQPLRLVAITMTWGTAMQDAQDELLTVAQAIAAMKISRSSWQKLAATGKIPPIIKIGSVQRIRREAFAAWLREREQAA